MTLQLEAFIAEAQLRHAARIRALDALAQEHSALGEALNEGLAERSTVWDVVSAAFGPGEVAPHLRKLLGRIAVFSALAESDTDHEGPSAATLERKLETVQRELIRLDLHLERLAADEDALEGELGDITARIAAASALEQVRLRSVLGLHHELHQLTQAVQRHLRELREAADETLDALDRQVSRLAAEAQAHALAQVVAGDLDEVRAAVARVNRCAAASAVLLTENLDRLADEVDLLAPNTAGARRAEAEVADALHNESLDDLLRYTRAQAARSRDARSQAARSQAARSPAAIGPAALSPEDDDA